MTKGSSSWGRYRTQGAQWLLCSPTLERLVETLPGHQVVGSVDRKSPAGDRVLTRGVDVVPECGRASGGGARM